MNAKVQELKAPAATTTERGPWAVLEWRLQEGDPFAENEPIVDLIDPAGILTIVAPASGRLSEVLVDTGSGVDAGETLGLLILR